MSPIPGCLAIDERNMYADIREEKTLCMHVYIKKREKTIKAK